MTPPCHSFSSSDLSREIQVDVHGRARKVIGGGAIDLQRCELLAMLQYHCSVDHPEQSSSPVRCWPVKRLFRRYAPRIFFFDLIFFCRQMTAEAPYRGSARPCRADSCGRCQDKKGSFVAETTGVEGPATISASLCSDAGEGGADGVA